MSEIDPLLFYGWEHSWQKPPSLLLINEILKSPFTTPSLVNSFPYITYSKEDGNGNSFRLRDGIPDPWVDYLIYNSTLPTKYLPSYELMHKEDVEIVHTLRRDYRLYLGQGIPDPFTSLSRLKNSEFHTNDLKADIKNYYMKLFNGGTFGEVFIEPSCQFCRKNDFSECPETIQKNVNDARESHKCDCYKSHINSTAECDENCKCIQKMQNWVLENVNLINYNNIKNTNTNISDNNTENTIIDYNKSKGDGNQSGNTGIPKHKVVSPKTSSTKMPKFNSTFYVRNKTFAFAGWPDHPRDSNNPLEPIQLEIPSDEEKFDKKKFIFKDETLNFTQKKDKEKKESKINFSPYVKYISLKTKDIKQKLLKKSSFSSWIPWSNRSEQPEIVSKKKVSATKEIQTEVDNFEKICKLSEAKAIYQNLEQLQESNQLSDRNYLQKRKTNAYQNPQVSSSCNYHSRNPSFSCERPVSNWNSPLPEQKHKQCNCGQQKNFIETKRQMHMERELEPRPIKPLYRLDFNGYYPVTTKRNVRLKKKRGAIPKHHHHHRMEISGKRNLVCTCPVYNNVFKTPTRSIQDFPDQEEVTLENLREKFIYNFESSNKSPPKLTGLAPPSRKFKPHQKRYEYKNDKFFNRQNLDSDHSHEPFMYLYPPKCNNISPLERLNTPKQSSEVMSDVSGLDIKATKIKFFKDFVDSDESTVFGLIRDPAKSSKFARMRRKIIARKKMNQKQFSTSLSQNSLRVRPTQATISPQVEKAKDCESPSSKAVSENKNVGLKTVKPCEKSVNINTNDHQIGTFSLATAAKLLDSQQFEKAFTDTKNRVRQDILSKQFKALSKNSTIDSELPLVPVPRRNNETGKVMNSESWSSETLKSVVCHLIGPDTSNIENPTEL